MTGTVRRVLTRSRLESTQFSPSSAFPEGPLRALRPSNPGIPFLGPREVPTRYFGGRRVPTPRQFYRGLDYTKEWTVHRRHTVAPYFRRLSPLSGPGHGSSDTRRDLLTRRVDVVLRVRDPSLCGEIALDDGRSVK